MLKFEICFEILPTVSPDPDSETSRERRGRRHRPVLITVNIITVLTLFRVVETLRVRSFASSSAIAGFRVAESFRT